MRGGLRYLLWVLVILSSCVDPISFKTESTGRQLVFDGYFTQLNENHFFKISRTADFGKTILPVSGASVAIIDDLGNSADYEEIDLGNYELCTDRIQGIPGRFYHVEITLADGRKYFTVPQIMPEPVEADVIYFNIESREVLSSSDILVERTFIDVFIDTPLVTSSGEPSNIRWAVQEVYSFTDRSCGPFDYANTCYFQDPVEDSKVRLFAKDLGAQTYLKGLNIRSRSILPFDEFTGRHYFIANQFTISDESLKYWERINAVTNQSGSLFDVQPAKVRGNIIEKDNEKALVLGYFEVSGLSKLRTFTTPREIKKFQPLFTCLDWSYYRDHQDICCYCSLKSGDHIERPVYWDLDR